MSSTRHNYKSPGKWEVMVHIAINKIESNYLYLKISQKSAGFTIRRKTHCNFVNERNIVYKHFMVHKSSPHLHAPLPSTFSPPCAALREHQLSYELKRYWYMYQKIQMINKFRPSHYKLRAVLNQQGNSNKLAQVFLVQHEWTKKDKISFCYEI